MAHLRIIVKETSWTPRHHVTETEKTIEADTIEDCFLKLYKMNRTLRYINDRNIVPAPEFRNAYDRWYDSLSESTKFDMFYGNGIVD